MTSSNSVDIERAIADALWMQWRAFGVQTGSAPARQLIDPEVLLIESAIVAARIDDPRIADAAIAWASQQHELVITARLKSMLKRYDESEQEAFLVLSRRVIDIAGRLAWPAAEAASAWKTSVDVQLPRLADRPELLRLRTRALFGANARAETIAFLTCVGATGTDLAMIERATLFRKRHLAGPLEQLVAEGSVERWWLGNRQQFRLSGAARGFLGYPNHHVDRALKAVTGTQAPQTLAPAGGPAWIDWHGRLQLARLIGAAAARIEGPGGVVSAVGRIRSAADELQQQGIQPPKPLEIDADSAVGAAELASWMASTNAILLAV